MGAFYSQSTRTNGLCYQFCYRTDLFWAKGAIYSRPKNRVEPICCVALHVLRDVRVQVQGRCNRRVPQTLLGDLRMHAGEQELGRVAMPQVMEAHARQVSHSGDKARELMRQAWGAPHIHGELLKLGFTIAQSTVARYMYRGWPPSQGWRTFLTNHVDGIAAIDLFVLPTITFRLLYCLVILRHGRRLWVTFGVTTNPTAEWISRQIIEAFPWDSSPRYLIRDRDTAYGLVFRQRLRAMGIRDKPTAPRSPWQNPYVERLIGTIRRECLDHMIVFGEAHLRRILGRYAAYYNESRIHRSLDKDTPFHRAIDRFGVITSQPVLGGLHHQYCRI